MSNLIRNTITSMEVAKMVGKEHSKLLRDIRNYVVQLGEAKIGFTDFFKEATYTTEQNKILPCFQVTKKGCEFIAHRKEKSMIKVEKKGNTTKATVEGNTYVLVDEFQTVLHALYQLLEKNIKESESVTPRDLMHSMVEDVVQKEKEMR